MGRKQNGVVDHASASAENTFATAAVNLLEKSFWRAALQSCHYGLAQCEPVKSINDCLFIVIPRVLTLKVQQREFLIIAI